MKTKVTKSKAVAFMYLILRDCITPGAAERIMEDLDKGATSFKMSNGFLASHAEDIIDRLTKGS